MNLNTYLFFAAQTNGQGQSFLVSSSLKRSQAARAESWWESSRRQAVKRGVNSTATISDSSSRCMMSDFTVAKHRPSHPSALQMATGMSVPGSRKLSPFVSRLALARRIRSDAHAPLETSRACAGTHSSRRHRRSTALEATVRWRPTEISRR